MSINFAIGWVFIVLLCGEAVAAGLSSQTLNIIDRPLAAWLLDLERPGPDSVDDFAAAAERRDSFRQVLRYVVAGNWAAAAPLAARLEFEIARIRDKDRSFVAVFPAALSTGDPTIVINAAPRTDLIAGVPHPVHEKGTIEIASLLVGEMGARAAIIAGAHRCASDAFVACDGKTRACGRTERYRTSDVAHSPETLFHAAHDALRAAWPKAVVMSLHGMRNDKDGVATSVVISNGIKRPEREKYTPAARFRFALGKTLKGPGVVVSCNHPPDRSFGYRRLCGTTNVQGRAVNGEDDVCRSGADRANGQFIHVEHARSLRSRFRDGWRAPLSDPIIRGYLKALRSAAPSIP